jgi:hypothetical protein
MIAPGREMPLASPPAHDPLTVLSGMIGIRAAARILEWLARDEHSSVHFDVPAPGCGERIDVTMDCAAATLA